MSHRLRFAVFGAGATLAIVLAACGNGAPATSSSGGGGGGCSAGTASAGTAAADVKVSATDALQFSPATTTAKVGQVVQWTNVGSVLHNITFDTGCLTDGSFQPGATWEIKFTQAGTYNYKCTIHPGMDAKLTVTS
ncbi:MAG TPA: plastocyanin/azurin family copper-binding protein [Candidatus Dormibacteraeota bacterium]